ncbi:MAG: nucleotide sugar dehydrogenase [Colwellia sp.]|nr:nucleotide sugar dehydrogenase [Colwellia sp.]
MFKFAPYSFKSIPFDVPSQSVQSFSLEPSLFEHDRYQVYEDQFEQVSESINLAKNETLNLSIIGLGYVGAVSCACFTSLGHTVIGVDQDISKVNAIRAGKSPIVEKDLGLLLSKAHQLQQLDATNDINEAIMSSDVTLISVGTPSNKDGSCNLDFLKSATQQMAAALSQKNQYHLFVFRSTVPPTTTKDIMIPILESYSNKKCGIDFGVCFNPEFLRESTAVDDFYHPPKTVIGAIDKKSAELAAKLYNNVEGDVIHTSLEAAEFVKYIDNTWHALKVSFGNEVGRICKAMAVDSHEVMNIFLQDHKLNISPNYLKPGFAFGGSCLPKDTRSIVYMAEQLNVALPIIGKINKSNQCHITHTVEMINQLAVSKVGIVGITFKSETDDLRESPSIELLKRLLKQGYQVQFYDPYIQEGQCLDVDDDINRKLLKAKCNSIDELVDNNHALVITHKEEYTKNLVKETLANKHIIDVVHLSENESRSEYYHGLCW